jgi:hypothetical protein
MWLTTWENNAATLDAIASVSSLDVNSTPSR